MKLAVVLSREEIGMLSTPVIVEQYEKKNFGRVKRAWLSEFSEKERKRASALYKKFYSWYLIKGNPEKFICTPETLSLINRLTNFFGTI